MENYNLDKNIIFVDSTLPIFFLKKNSLKIKNSKIYCKRDSVYKSLKYAFPKKKIFFIRNFLSIQIFYLLIKIKFKKKKIIFFHECCNPIFDLVVDILKIKGFYIPITNPLKIVKPLKNEIYKIEGLGLFKKFFYFFFEKPILSYFYIWNRKNKFYFVYKNYNKNIKKIKINSIDNKKRKKEFIKKSKILLLTSKVPNVGYIDCNNIMEKCFYEIIKFCIRNNIKVYAKDHPEKSQRTKLNHKNLKSIDPYMPSEMIDYERFDYFISLTSNSLCAFGGKAISIVNLISKKKNIIKFYKQTYVNRDFTDIFYPKSMKELENVILKN